MTTEIETAAAPWLADSWRQLWQLQRDRRLPHALLFSGPPGMGKLGFAERLLQALLCSNASPAGVACGDCANCHLFAAANHPDYQHVGLEADSKQIKVDQVRAVTDFLNHSSHSGRLKASILVPAERMNPNAANGLLKTLEEPPPKSLLILLTTAPSRLAATVLSRCHRLAFVRPPRTTALHWLQQRLPDSGAGELDAGLLLDLAEGAPIAALNGADSRVLERRAALFASYSRVVMGDQPSLANAGDWLKDDPPTALRWLLSWLHDLIRLRIARDSPPELVNTDLVPALARISGRFETRRWLQLYDMAHNLLKQSDTTVNLELAVDSFLLSHVTPAGSEREVEA